MSNNIQETFNKLMEETKKDTGKINTEDKRIREDIERYTTLVDKLAGTVSSVPNWEKMYNEVIDAVAPWRAEDLTKDNFQLYLETIFERLCVTIEKHMNIIERYEKSKNKQSSPHEE